MAAAPSTARPRALDAIASSSLTNPVLPLSNPKKPLSFSSRAPQLFGGLRRAPRPQLVPIIRSQSSPIPDYVPDSKFYKIEAVLRPWRVPHVSSGLLQMGIRGVTVSDVRGFGAQGGSTERHGGSEFSEDKFISKVKMEIVICKEQVEAVINKIIEEARTGEIGDGKIFLIPVSDVIRVRTGERGEMAERMNGGHADMTASVASK
ncbi:nitrogen regulatory protein P-II homolog [Ananas comosus]|uniref:Nitrogen regulatory protein P-II homolog n=1 Tax=Ananas comosus TaxID=4615 RepID=A0A6P5F0B4_ANACO|nr:nitrogen regulatory protein P-II homolog [Ananas comosus]